MISLSFLESSILSWSFSKKPVTKKHWKKERALRGFPWEYLITNLSTSWFIFLKIVDA